MTLNPAASSALPVQLSLRDRHAILENVLAALRKRFYSPEKLTGDWPAAVERHRPLIESAATADAFEKAMSDLLAELHTSHLGFFHSSARRASSRAALSATYLEDETPYGKRWIFQDVHAGGAAAIAGIEPGDILLSVDGREITPPEHPVFAMGKQTSVEFVDRSDQRRTVSVEVARPKGKKLHFIEPTLVEARQLGDGLGYLKIAMFPGMIGVEVANEISRAVEELGRIDSLIIDLRGNTGGGIGALRVMSMITPGRVPVGFALDRHRVTANLESEKQGFPSILANSIFNENPLVACLAVWTGDDGKEAHRASNRGARRETISREGRSPGEPPHRKRRGNDCRVCTREPARHNRRRENGWSSPLRNFRQSRQWISVGDAHRSVLHMERVGAGRNADGTGRTDRVQLARTTGAGGRPT
jgi:hypothetical protein